MQVLPAKLRHVGEEVALLYMPASLQPSALLRQRALEPRGGSSPGAGVAGTSPGTDQWAAGGPAGASRRFTLAKIVGELARRSNDALRRSRCRR
jgi:hypothetical protein